MNNNGNIVDQDDNVIDITEYGFDLDTVAETQTDEDPSVEYSQALSQMSAWAASTATIVQPQFSSGTIQRNIAKISIKL